MRSGLYSNTFSHTTICLNYKDTNTIKTFDIALVLHGSISETKYVLNGKSDPYEVPRSMDILKVLESSKEITTSSVAQRIVANHEIYVKRNAKKKASKNKYYAEKKYVSGD